MCRAKARRYNGNYNERGKEKPMSEQSIKEVVKERYGQAALRVIKGGSTCCGAAPAVV